MVSVWTCNAQFLSTALNSFPDCRWNLPSFVDLQTGGWGILTIQDSLNSSQTPTMANFATLADLLLARATRGRQRMHAASCLRPRPTRKATRRKIHWRRRSPSRAILGTIPFVLLAEFYPLVAGNMMRAVPFMPYLNFPTAGVCH